MAKQKTSNKELAKAHVFPHGLSVEEKKQADQELLRLRMKRLNEASEKQRIYSSLLQLRYNMEDYTKGNWFDPSRTFNYFLSQYISILNCKNYEFANEISMHQTALSRILNNKEQPNIELMYRLEKHSGETITATLWWKLVEKHTAYLISNNSIDRKREWRKVKNQLKFNV